MTTFAWQPDTPIEAFVFDCDGTLSTLEGIDELARNNGVGEIVESLTANAMAKTGMSPEFYQKRLDLVKPRSEQLVALGQVYFQHQIPDVKQVIQLLSRLNKSIYIVSAGFSTSVELFGELLQIPRKNIFAVKIQFDANGEYIDFDRNSVLVTRDGKRDIVSQLKKHHSTILHVGDGLNDYVVYDLVTRFVGFGGVFYRENIATNCEYYIKSVSMAPLLPLSLTQDECTSLAHEDVQLYQKGLKEILNKNVLVNAISRNACEKLPVTELDF